MAAPDLGDDPSAAARAALEALRAGYRERLPQRWAEVEAAWAAVRRDPGPEALEALRALAHGLAGAAGSYGLPEVSAAARVVDESIRGAAGQASAELLAALPAALAALGAACAAGQAP